MQSFSNDELLALLGAARRASERDWLMILVAYWHGLRASEVTAIQQHDVADGYLTVRRLKGSLKTVQPLIEHKVVLLNERRAFENFVAAMRPNQKVFPIGRVWFWRLVQRYAREARIPRRKAHPHALKHSIASHTIGLAGIENVRQWGSGTSRSVRQERTCASQMIRLRTRFVPRCAPFDLPPENAAEPASTGVHLISLRGFSNGRRKRAQWRAEGRSRTQGKDGLDRGRW